MLYIYFKKLVCFRLEKGNIFSLLYLKYSTISKLVYSTDDSICTSDEDGTVIRRDPSDQKVRLHLDRKGGGKVVSIVKGLSESPDTLNTIAKELKKKVWCRRFCKKG